jgi:ABC-type bacteriocin/lantibiotic exporter with double-glycine peptidase domain
MNIGQFVAAEIIILLVITSVEKIILGLETFYDLLTSLEKLGQVVDKDLESQEGGKPDWENQPFTIELKEVSYRLPNTEHFSINSLSMLIAPQDRIWIPSVSGSGKTTLLHLISGVLSPSSGSIFVNNKALKGINLNYYRGHLGSVFSAETPFEGSILDNITFGDKDLSPADLDWAIEKTKLTEFVKAQSKGVDTILYPEGQYIPMSVSKKIMLARSIVKKPKLLLLKDPLDQMDEADARAIMEFLVDASNPWSLVVVSKNGAWQPLCNRVVKLAKGKMVSDLIN